MNKGAFYEALGPTLDAAVQNAHAQIPPRQGRDFTMSRVIEWGMQHGGFVGTRQFYAKVVEDESAPPKT